MTFATVKSFFEIFLEKNFEGTAEEALPKNEMQEHIDIFSFGKIFFHNLKNFFVKL